MSTRGSAYKPEAIIKKLKEAGEATKRAVAGGGAVLVITMEKAPEGLISRYFSFCFLDFPRVQQVVEDQTYQTLAREAEERLRGEITPSEPVN